MEDTRDVLNERVKKEVEERLNLKNGKCDSCACGKYKGQDAGFLYNTERGSYKCLHYNECPLSSDKGNYHVLNNDLKVIPKEEIKEEIKQERKRNFKKFDDTPTHIYYDKDGNTLFGKLKLKWEQDGETIKTYLPCILENNEWVAIRKNIKKQPNPDFQRLQDIFNSIERVPYNLHKFKNAKYLWICEGEKCADLLQKALDELCQNNDAKFGELTFNQGEHVTTSLYSTKSWKQYYTDIVAEYGFKRIINVLDNDQAGYDYARQIHQNLEDHGATKGKLIHLLLSELEQGEGVDDYLESREFDCSQIAFYASEDIVETNAQLFFLRDDYKPARILEKEEKQQEEKVYELNEVGNRERFLDMFGGQVIYVRGLGWHKWTGSYWEFVEDGSSIKELIIESTKRILKLFEPFNKKLQQLLSEDWGENEKKKEKAIKGIESRIGKIQTFYDSSMSSHHIESCYRLAMNHPRVYRKSEVLNHRKDLLNVKNGVVDLKTGLLLPHEKTYYFTHCVEIEFPRLKGKYPEPVPTWNAFLDSTFVRSKIGDDKKQHFEVDPELIEYMQIQLGYCLTGEMQQQQIFFLSGHGSNGKSTFINIAEKLLGGFAKTVNPDTLMQTNNKSPINNDIARTFDSRLIIAPEVEEGSQWNLSLVKAITGGDTITARFLRKEFFDFKSTAKLAVFGNYQPYLKGLDDGTKRRFKIVPFLAKFDGSTKKKNLGLHLDQELPGILQWAVQGAVKYYSLLGQNLEVPLPNSVKLATEKYFYDNDPVQTFLEEHFMENDFYASKTDDYNCVPVNDLYKEYSTFCKESGKHSMARDKFVRVLIQRGAVKKRKRIDSKRCQVFDGMSIFAEQFKISEDPDFLKESKDSLF